MIEFTRQANYMLLGAVNAMKQEVRTGHIIEEPDYLTAIVTKFPKLMKSSWSGVKYGGCFIHKSPQVSFKKGGRCEAGDLLVLCRETIGEEARYNAALFQLKKLKDSCCEYEVKTRNEQVQYELYTKWPEFSIGGKFYPGNALNIEPKTVTPGAQYLLINDPDDMVRDYWYQYCCHHYPCIFTHSIPRQMMGSRVDLTFGRFLWDFIHWQNGRPIATQDKATTDEWSQFIWKLISKTQRVMVQNINVGITKASGIPKQQGDFFHLLTTKECMSYIPQSYYNWVERGDDGYKDIIPEEINEEETGAISILFIDLIGQRQ